MSSHVRSIFGLKILKRQHKALKNLNKSGDEPSMYGNQVWHSSFFMMDYLKNFPLANDQQVMDIGCGWGLVGIFCAKHFDSKVVLIDADCNVFPYAHSHRELNQVELRTCQARFDELKPVDFASQDVILGSDICFWPELSTQLKSLVPIALQARVKKIIFADPGRNTFMQFADYCAQHFNARLEKWELQGRTKTRGYLLIIDNVR